MPFDPTDPRYTSPLANMAQDRMTGMMNQPQLKVFADAPQDGGVNPVSPIMPGQMQLNRTMGMARGGAVNDELAGIKDTIRAEFAARGLDFDRFVSNPAVMDEVGKSIQSQGKNGDTILAHINPQEANLLKEMGGSGTVNPATGLPQFYFGDISSYGGSTPSSSSNDSYGSIGGGGGSAFDIGGISAGGGGGYGSTYGGSGNGSFSDFGGDTFDNGGVSGSVSYGGGGGDGGRDFYATMPRSTATETSLSPMGAGSGSVSMGQAQPQANEAIGSIPSFAGIDPMSGLPIGGASNISGLGYLATAPDLAQTIAPQPTSVDLGNTAPQLSNIDFSNISPGMYQGATMPGGISNFASSPVNPGYVDPGVTAMRLAASDPTAGRGTEYYMGKLGGVDPRVQGQFLGMINDRMAANIPTAITPRGSFRTTADQIALAAEKAAGLNPNVVSAPGTSLHELMTIDPYTGEEIPGSLALDVGGRSLTPAQTNQAIDIANSYGLYGNQIIDPGHFQAVPFQKGAMQLAQAKYPSPNVTEPSMLQSALNTVSNIAGELFGVKSAEAQTPEKMMENMAPLAGIDTREFGSPFIASGVAGMAFPPQSQQQMLDVLGIGGSPIAPERAAPPAQVSGSGVFPSYPQTSGTQPVPVAGKIGTDPQSGRDLFVDINSNEFTVNPGTGARQYTKFSTSTPASPVVTSTTIGPTIVSPKVVKKPEPILRGLPPVQKVQDRAPSASTAGLTGFEAALGTTPVAQAASLGSPYVSYGAEPTSFAGLTPLTPLQEAISSTPSPTVAPRITTGITSPITAEGISPRQEPLDPTQSTSPMTAEQLQSLGVYQTPLKEGQRVRDNFNEAYGDATARGIEVFEWTNPATGKTDFYKSGAPEADLPSKIAKNAKGDFPFPQTSVAPQTEYEKTVAALEANDMIANGMSKEEYADAMGVPVDQVKTRITTQFGPPMAEYYTKTVLESLAGMTGDEGNFAGLMNLTSMFSPLGILGLAGKAGYNAYRKRSENKADGGYVSPLASMGKK